MLWLLERPIEMHAKAEVVQQQRGSADPEPFPIDLCLAGTQQATSAACAATRSTCHNQDGGSTSSRCNGCPGFTCSHFCHKSNQANQYRQQLCRSERLSPSSLHAQSLSANDQKQMRRNFIDAQA